MKRYISIFTTVLSLLAVVGVTGVATAREVYNVSSGWTFFTADVPSTDFSTIIDLPHIQTSSLTANYLKDIDIPLEWEGRRIFMRIGGAATVADVFVGGIHTATHRGASAPFTFEITDRLTPGGPVSVRIVVSSAPRLDVLPTAGSEKVYCGIYRGVELIVCDPLSISPAALFPDASPGTSSPVTSARKEAEGGDGVWIVTDRLTGESAEGRVRLSLLTPSALPEGAFVRVRFTDADGNQVAQNSVPLSELIPAMSTASASGTLSSEGSLSAGGVPADIPFTLSNPRLWQGTRDPYLYDVEVALTTGAGAALDSLSVRTGFRTVAVDADNNFTLNGSPLKIRGVILHRDRRVVGTALTPFQIEEDVDFILEMGANAVRVAGGRHSDYFYTLCDEAGLIVWNDDPFTGAAYPADIDFVDTGEFRNNGLRQLREMISGLYNHPSVAMWGIFSNVSMRTDPRPYIRELNDLAHRLDPHRLTAASSVSDGEVNFIPDMVSFSLSFGWETGLPDGIVPWLEQLRGGWPDLRAGISYSAGASIFQQSERLEKPSFSSNYHPEGWQTFFHGEYMRYAVDAPGLWGVFVGDMFDSGAAKETSTALVGVQTGEAGIDDSGLVTFDRKDRKDAFWVYKAAWNASEPFVRIAGSRLDIRYEHRQTIRVYSNLTEVELFMGGRSQGRRTGEKGVFTWENVSMRTGLNRLEARGTGAISPATGFDVTDSAGVAGTANSSEATIPAGSTSGPATVVATDRASINIHPTAATTPRQQGPRTSADQ
jgi:beta-galactosidase